MASAVGDSDLPVRQSRWGHRRRPLAQKVRRGEGFFVVLTIPQRGQCGGPWRPADPRQGGDCMIVELDLSAARTSVAALRRDSPDAGDPQCPCLQRRVISKAATLPPEGRSCSSTSRD